MSNLPTTSLDAYKSLTPEMLSKHYGKIIQALRDIESGIYEEIADKTGLERHKVARRLSELERLSVIYKPGEKKPTSTGRSAFVYKLVPTEPIQTELF